MVVEGYGSKKKIFGHDGDYIFDESSAKIRAEVDEIIGNAEQGKRMQHVFVDFLKDECRPLQKVLEKKTRLISAAPLSFLIVFRMYFLDFFVAIQQARIDCGIAVGINPYTEWKRLSDHLRRKGPQCFAGDYSGWDSCLVPQVFAKILDLISDWYDDGETNRLVRRVLWEEVLASKHLGGDSVRKDLVYMWLKGLPSGTPGTSIINSLYNQIVMVMCWIREFGPEKATCFWEFVGMCTYGDDNVVNPHYSVIGRFNQSTVTEHMAELGFVYTGEAKEDELRPFRELSEISFLKRGFNYEGRECYAALDLDTILEIPYWAYGAENMESTVRSNVEVALRELSLHPAAVWDAWYPKIRQHAQVCIQYTPDLPNQLAYRNATVNYKPPWL